MVVYPDQISGQITDSGQYSEVVNFGNFGLLKQ